MNEDPPMKVSFTVKITGCDLGNITCPHLYDKRHHMKCFITGSPKTVKENKNKLTKTCPMGRDKFENTNT